MNFEQEYQLQEFKEIQDEYFDKTGACYTGNTIGTNIMERMLKLIDVLSERSKNTETMDKHEPRQLILPIVINWVATDKQEPPEYSGDLLVSKDGKVIVCWYQNHNKLWWHSTISNFEGKGTYWAEIPKPPCL